MTPKCDHGTDVDEDCARCQLRGAAYNEISETQAKALLALWQTGLAARLKPHADWLDAVEAAADVLETDYDHPQEPTFQQALEMVDSSQWVNSGAFQMSAIFYGEWYAWACHDGGLLDQEDPLCDLARFAMAGAVLEVVEGRVRDREENE